MLFERIRSFRASISLRLAGLFCLTFALAILATFAITYFEISYTLEKSSKEVIAAKLRECSGVLANDGRVGLEHFLRTEKNNALDSHFMIRVLRANGKSLYLKPSIQKKSFDFSRLLDPEQGAEYSAEKVLGWRSLSAINDEDKFDVLTEKIADDLYLQVGRSSEDREDLLDDILAIFSIASAIFTFLSAGIGYWYARRSLAPIRNLLTTMCEIESGDLTKRVDVDGARDELNDLAQTFNRMIARIENLIQIMRESLDNVAHDIRTPLTRIRAVAEMTLVSGDNGRLQSALEDCAEGAGEISGLVDQLLSISEAEAGTLQLQREACQLSQLLSEVIEVYEFVAQERSISVELQCDTSIEWSLDRRRMKQAFGNLLDNALKFSPSETRVGISVKRTQNQLIVDVSDEGIGIPPEDLGRIWDRLFRGDKSRTTKGSGVGLAIVRAIILAHGGNTMAAPNASRGMYFSVVLNEVKQSGELPN